jgi:hypothetical protein
MQGDGSASSNGNGRVATAAARAGSVAAVGQGEGREVEGGATTQPQQEEEEEEEVGLLEQALAALEAARQQLAEADAHVREYSRTTAFSPAEYKTKSERLALVSGCCATTKYEYCEDDEMLL